jgi:hypothetical protein
VAYYPQAAGQLHTPDERALRKAPGFTLRNALAARLAGVIEP